jgi:hypothetical protein
VIDEIDDCPAIADWDQRNARGSGPGDACATAGMPPPGDGAGGGDMAMAPKPPVDMAPSLCDPTRTTICESFESGLLDPNVWSQGSTSGSVVSLDATHVYRGTQAIKVHAAAVAQGQFGEATLVNKTMFPATDLFVRAFVYVPAGFPAAAAALFNVGQSTSPYHTTGLQLDSAGFATFNELAAQPVYKGVAGTIATDRWVCVEWEVKLDKAGLVNVWVDGTALTALSGAQDLSSNPAVGELHLGLAAQASVNIPARDVWMDEVAVGTTRIGCGQ